jgi:hypothetical protein
MMFPEKVYPVRNSSGALNLAGIIIKPDSAAQQRGIISNEVNITSSGAPGSALCRPVRCYGLLGSLQL